MDFRKVIGALACGTAVLVTGCGGTSDGDSQHAAAVVEESQAQQAPEPTPDEAVAGLEAMCAEAQPAIEARRAADTLFNRVGGREGIHKAVAETVRLHQINEPIKRVMEGVDPEHLVKQVTDFLVLATGGQGDYDGRDMVSAHAHLSLSNADFLAAGSDLGKGMTFAGWGEGEKQELLCAFVGLRSQVVTTEG